MPAEQPIEQQPRVADAAGFFRARDVEQRGLVPGDRLASPIAQPVQAHVGRDPVEQARRITAVQARAPLHDADEHVLAGVEGLVLVAEEPPAPAKHHRSVAVAQSLDVEVVHAALLNTVRAEKCYRMSNGTRAGAWRVSSAPSRVSKACPTRFPAGSSSSGPAASACGPACHGSRGTKVHCVSPAAIRTSPATAASPRTTVSARSSSARSSAQGNDTTRGSREAAAGAAIFQPAVDSGRSIAGPTR